MPPNHRDLIREQHGAICRSQLLAAGWTRHRIAHARGSGELVELVGTVYRASTHTVLPETVVHGVLLWLGEGGVLIGQAAAWWWGMLREAPEVLDFSGPRRRISAPSPARVHQVYVDSVDRTTHRGIRVLTQPMAALRAAADLERSRSGAGITLIDRAIQEGLDHREFVGILTRHRYCTGNALGRYITDITSDDSESIGERRTAALMSSAGISGWHQQVWVGAGATSYRVDFAFERERVIVEFDGFAFHSTPERFSTDKRRDDDLRAAGWKVVHITWKQLHASPEDVVRRIKRALGR